MTLYDSVADDADVQSVVTSDCCHSDVSLDTATEHRSVEVNGRDGYVISNAIRPTLIHVTSSIAHRLPISTPCIKRKAHKRSHGALGAIATSPKSPRLKGHLLPHDAFWAVSASKMQTFPGLSPKPRWGVLTAFPQIPYMEGGAFSGKGFLRRGQRAPSLRTPSPLSACGPQECPCQDTFLATLMAR